MAHARPAEAELERDDRGVSSLDVHGAGPSRPRPRSSHRSGSDSIRKGARHPRDAPPRFGLWRADLHASRFRANDGDALVLGTRKASPWTRSHLPENGATREMTIPSVRARKPSCRPTFGKVIPCSRSYKTDSRLLALQGSCFVLELVGIDIALLEPLPERYESWRCRLSCLLDGSEDTKRSGWD